MTRIAWFDCWSGAAGDMILGALVDVGLDPRLVESLPARLGLGGTRVEVGRVRRGPIEAARVEVHLRHGSSHDPGALTLDHHHGRHLSEVLERVERADLPATVREKAAAIFRRLAWAEGAVHGMPAEEVHFHEVGADDALVDICGAALGLEALGVERVECGPLADGTGTVGSAHGPLPVPSPATAKLLEGFEWRQVAIPRELLTPTGAAILTTLAAQTGACPAMRIEHVGYGAGGRDHPERPNVLRVFLGCRDEAAGPTDTVWQLETQVDDATPEELGFLQERLFEAGALDVVFTAAQMKKGRPGTRVTVLAPPAGREGVEAALFAGSGTFGIRHQLVERVLLERELVPVETPYGTVRIKVGRRGGKDLAASPEYEDCKRAALAAGVSLREVQQAALAAYRAQRPA